MDFVINREPKCCSEFSVQHELPCSLESVSLQYSCREKNDVNFFKRFIADKSTESVNWSTVVVVKRSSSNTRRE